MLTVATIARVCCAIIFCLGSGRTSDSPGESLRAPHAEQGEILVESSRSSLVSLAEETLRLLWVEVETTCPACIEESDEERAASVAVGSFSLRGRAIVSVGHLDGALWSDWQRPFP